MTGWFVCLAAWSIPGVIWLSAAWFMQRVEDHYRAQAQQWPRPSRRVGVTQPPVGPPARRDGFVPTWPQSRGK